MSLLLKQRLALCETTLDTMANALATVGYERMQIDGVPSKRTCIYCETEHGAAHTSNCPVGRAEAQKHAYDKLRKEQDANQDQT